ncbi:CheR family methyltransferase [Deinococcus yavapaiensis]|uniref:CheR-type MCP methyltransferase n=1 Tax=Deinococcus yavapaiensis KR-236 TaxID=694435 RepID=A0A318SCH6_9DEIO|nr:protein-glutamate O-methyltransferase CheR [Deinococcus yavapaiensis]PYE49390.1 CheR-type MCP methyltransferase [Deinococcus yavapaiensis KR-236]
MTFADDEIEDLEVALLLEGVYRRYGFDFRGYAPATLKRRVMHCARTSNLSSVSALQERVLRDRDAFQDFVSCVAVGVTEMFRDPGFYATLRDAVVPLLRTNPFVRVWHAGCSSGEEVYSTAILLHEAGLLNRTRLYATDLNPKALARARDGIYPRDRMEGYARNYHEAGGERDFASYFTRSYDHAIVRGDLKRQITWGQHNLVTDGSFNDFHLILCRNVLIYFDKPLQARVHELLFESLAPSGVLGLGRHETLTFSPVQSRFVELDAREKLYRRVA